ncbi:hypothetical protein DVH24_005679 [Malus domestica]|uniref:HAT C-terminal dimerisation domain-containing protein n=1 Tax=Malus domestica TaxID=3750 RepID=A0A498IJ85_MALDO|nr:hypothetical protein DVH24_005679 [Malus domestica]
MEPNALKNTVSSKKDFAWQWTKDFYLVTKHFYCVFCNHKYTGSISRFKHHLSGVSLGGMISCKKVPPNVNEECFANVMGTKEKRKASNELCLVVKMSTWAQQGHHIGETPMGFIYELMDAAKEKIASNLNKVEKKYMPIWRKIDRRWDDLLHQPLHAAGYYLNPQFQYEDNFSDTDEVRNGLFACMNMIFGKRKEREESEYDIWERERTRGPFEDSMAMQTRKKRTPMVWWERFGHKTPELTKFAIRVLSHTCSASGCERNWSTFSIIHTKRWNRLEHKRLYNREVRKGEKYDPIVVEEIASDDEWIIEIEDPSIPEDPTWLEDKLLYNVEAVRNVPPPIYEGGPYIREPRESSPPPP